MNVVLDYLLLPVLFFIGLVTTYQDVKKGKIKNKWIVLGLVWGLGVYLFFLIFDLLSFSYVSKVLINIIIALILGYILWYFDLWSAGDAKLFFVFSLLLPLKYYWKSVLPYFPSFALLINIFILALFFLICQNLFYLFKKIFHLKITKQIVKDKFFKLKGKVKTNYLNYSKTLFGFFLIFMGFRIIKVEVKDLFPQYNWWQTAAILLIVVTRKSLKKVFQRKWFFFLFCLIIIFYFGIGYFFYSQPVLSKLISLIKSSLLFMIVFSALSSLVSLIEESKKKDLPFAILVLAGTLLTIILKGSLISFFLNPTLFLR